MLVDRSGFSTSKTAACFGMWPSLLSQMTSNTVCHLFHQSPSDFLFHDDLFSLETWPYSSVYQSSFYMSVSLLPSLSPPSLPHLSSEKGFLTFANFYFFIFSLPNELFTLGLPVLLSWKQPAPPLSLPPPLFAMLAHIWDYELRLLLYWTHLKVAFKKMLSSDSPLLLISLSILPFDLLFCWGGDEEH